MSDEMMLDALDRRILKALQVQGRMTYDELACGVALSASAALRRVKRLEEAGVITGYGARVAPEKMGLSLTAYVNVRLAKTSGVDHQSTSQATRTIEEGRAKTDCCKQRR